MKKCVFCGNEYKPLGIAGHERYCINNPMRLTANPGGAKKGCKSWNKGIKTTDEVRKKISDALKGKTTGLARSPEDEISRRIKISETMKGNPRSGGIRKGSGIGLKGWYKGIWCDSSWELAWLIYQQEMGNTPARNKKSFSYIFQGRTHKYYPDFFMNNIYLEIKGRRGYEDLDAKNKAKIDFFDNKGILKVLYKEEMQPILEYVIAKFGKEFFLLYEK